MDDLISRQAAIDALECKKDKNAKGDIGGFYNKIIQNDIDALMQLPSAQPEIIRCKDCKYREADDFCTGRGYPNMLVPDDGFCDKGKRILMPDDKGIIIERYTRGVMKNDLR